MASTYNLAIALAPNYVFWVTSTMISWFPRIERFRAHMIDGDDIVDDLFRFLVARYDIDRSLVHCTLVQLLGVFSPSGRTPDHALSAEEAYPAVVDTVLALLDDPFVADPDAGSQMCRNVFAVLAYFARITSSQPLAEILIDYVSTRGHVIAEYDWSLKAQEEWDRALRKLSRIPGVMEHNKGVEGVARPALAGHPITVKREPFLSSEHAEGLRRMLPSWPFTPLPPPAPHLPVVLPPPRPFVFPKIPVQAHPNGTNPVPKVRLVRTVERVPPLPLRLLLPPSPPLSLLVRPPRNNPMEIEEIAMLNARKRRLEVELARVSQRIADLELC